MEIHVNQIKFSGEDAWTKQFNLCSDLFIASNDESLTDEERRDYHNQWFEQKLRLELGHY